jgi:antitoxin PrlF
MFLFFGYQKVCFFIVLTVKKSIFLYFFTYPWYPLCMKAHKLSTLSSKGQTTIPQEIRKTLNLRSGDAIAFEVEDDGKVVLKKVRAQDDDLDYLKSIEMTLAPEWMSDDDDDL